MPRFPDFIIIGAPRCGTSSLAYNLSLHHEIYVAHTGYWPFTEIYYFNKGIPRKRGIDWYKNLFPDDKISGEKSPTYYLSKKAIEEIRCYIPDVKLIFCKRNPVERAYSEYKKSNLNMDLEDALKIAYYHRIIKPGYYDKHLENNVYPFFNKRKILIIQQEEMYKDTDQQMNRVFEFLGLDNFTGKFRKRKSDYKIPDEDRKLLEGYYSNNK